MGRSQNLRVPQPDPADQQRLLAGGIDAVVHQNMGCAGEIAMNALIAEFFGRPVEFPTVPIEIVMREKIPEQRPWGAAGGPDTF